MTAVSFARLAATIFALTALMQLARAVAGWPATFMGIDIPTWPNWIAGLMLAVLAWLGFSARP